MLSIRTQDRMALVPYKEEVWIREDGAIFTWDKNGVSKKLGQYANQEKALEVVDEIQYKAAYSQKCMSGKIAHDSSEHTYEMPK